MKKLNQLKEEEEDLNIKPIEEEEPKKKNKEETNNNIYMAL